MHSDNLKSVGHFSFPIALLIFGFFCYPLDVLGQSQDCLGYIAKAESSHRQAQLEITSAKNQLLQVQQRQKQIQALVTVGAGAKSNLTKIDRQLKQQQSEVNQAIATEKKALEQLRSLRMMSSCAV
jgi:multidrug resistance efflux pump